MEDEALNKVDSEASLEGLTPQEIRNIIGIIDLKPQFLDRVSPDNLDQIIQKGIGQLQERRKKANNFLEDTSVLEVILAKGSRSEGAHAIQCSVDAAVDARHFISFIESKTNIPNEDEDKKNIVDFFSRHAELNELMTELYSIDIIRRVGNEKENDNFYSKKQEKFSEVIQRLQPLLEAFLIQNKDRIALLSEADQQNIADKIDRLKSISPEEFDNLKDGGLYDDICDKLSELIRQDFEILNKPVLLKSAQNIRKVEYDEETLKNMRETLREHREDDEVVVLDFCFNYGITSNLTDELEEPADRLIKLLNFDQDAAKDFLNNQENFAKIKNFDKAVQAAQNCLKK
jgi:hypothetical protein